MVDLLKHIGSAEETAVRRDLCNKIQDHFTEVDTFICMDALTSLIVQGALALGHEREQFLSTIGEAYDVIKTVQNTHAENSN